MNASAKTLAVFLDRLRPLFWWLPRLILLGMAGLMVHVLFHRYPTEKEVRDHLAIPATAVVDGEQRDIGLFQVSGAADETFYLETFPQWVFPWQEYEWPESSP